MADELFTFAKDVLLPITVLCFWYLVKPFTQHKCGKLIVLPHFWSSSCELFM